MMNRFSSKDYLNGGGRNGQLASQSQHRRGQSLNGIISKNTTTDENLDLFSRNRRSLSVAPSDETEVKIQSSFLNFNATVSMKLGKFSVGSAKLSRNGMDDLLSTVEGEKHDYDWLLTPPGTPLFSSSEASEPRPSVAAPRSNSSVRSSRLSVTHSENSHSSRPARSSSVTRPSVSTMSHNSYTSNANRSTNILNTSSSSVTSMSRPSTAGGRPTSTSTARPATPTGRSVPSRQSTPMRSRPSPTSSGEKSRPSLSRSSTPTSRPQIPASLNSTGSRSNSRPATPTRRNSAPSQLPVTGRTASIGRGLPNGRNSAPSSRGSSPGPRARPPPQPIVPPDFSLDTPPNLRTTMSDRPVSAGRSRPSASVSARGNPEAPGPVNPPRRPSSPAGTRGRLPELSGRGRLHANGHSSVTENSRTQPVSEITSRKTAKPATATESTGFGRTISKKSLDMALRRMDIRNGSGSIRPMSGTTLFPQSIRSSTQKGQHTRTTDASVTNYGNRVPSMSNNAILDNGNCNDRRPDGVNAEDNGRLLAKVSEFDIYESSRYEALLLKEDAKNTSWLHGVDDQSDQGLIFDHRFEPLPEPFDPL